jgi:hypothetical protein
MHVDETPSSLWSIQGLQPPPPGFARRATLER